MPKTLIVDYGAGNLHSVKKSLEMASAGHDEIALCTQAEELRKADRIVLPGVGAYAYCMERLRAQNGMVESLNEFQKMGKPVLGICVGMQLLVQSGNEHGVKTQGLGWLSGSVERIHAQEFGLKTPHMGWNNLTIQNPHSVLSHLPSPSDVYFVHSYSVQNNAPEETLASVDYGESLIAAIGKDNIVGTQFHPEKSQDIGIQILKNFLNWRL